MQHQPVQAVAGSNTFGRGLLTFLSEKSQLYQKTSTATTDAAISVCHYIEKAPESKTNPISY